MARATRAQQGGERYRLKAFAIAAHGGMAAK
jgi:hypothetical protein